MNIFIFGGTTEGRTLSHQLAALGHAVTVSVATAYGAETQGNCPGVSVLCGRLTAQQMPPVLSGAQLCIDATHPYAVQASENIRAACAACGVPYRRLLRPAGAQGSAEIVPGAAAAAALLAKRSGKVLLTTGAKELGAFAPLGGERLVARVLPGMESLAACEAAGIPKKNIIAMQGPFGKELNCAILRQYGIRWMVTKNGGGPGGFAEKLQAAAECGAGVIVIARPQELGQSAEEILHEITQGGKTP